MAKTMMIHARIIDGTGAPAIEDGMLVMQHSSEGFNNDSIEYVGQMDEARLAAKTQEDRLIDLKNQYTVMPGLCDVHAHLDLKLPYLPYKYDDLGPGYRTLMAYRRAAEALNCGVTTIRNVGGADDYDLSLKKAFQKNMFCGPNMVTCGSIILANGGHGAEIWGSIECSGEAEFMKATRSQLAKGVDMIKICFTGGLAGANEGLNCKQMTNGEIAAVIEVAHAAGKKVAAHLSADAAIKTAVELGLDSVEHAYALKEETAQQMAEKGTYLTPTLCVSNCEEYLIAHGCPEHQVRKGREAALTHRKGIGYAVKHGVKICCGTDMLPSDPFDGTNAVVHEIELLTEVGLSALEAIKAATYNSAELCGLEKVTGSLKSGLMGDIIVVQGKPDENISDLRNLKFVAKNCRLIWSELPGLVCRPFHILAPGYNMEGGTFIDW